MTKKRTPSSKRWLREHETDTYVKRARAEGYRSRAVYKLEEISRKDHLLKPGMTVVDLGAAPGGWCQYIQRNFGDRITVVALDILPMDPVPGVCFLQGDFREPDVLAQLEQALAGRPVDLVLSDLSPNISGIDAADQAGTVLLAELALEFANQHLRPGGSLLIKLFQGGEADAYVRALRKRFEKVAIRKPAASRPRSREVYLLAQRVRVL